MGVKMKNIVIGSGPAGRLGSLELGKLGEEVLLIEKNHIAGTCLNEGCITISFSSWEIKLHGKFCKSFRQIFMALERLLLMRSNSTCR